MGMNRNATLLQDNLLKSFTKAIIRQSEGKQYIGKRQAIRSGGVL